MYGGYDMGEQYKQLQFRDRLKIEARLNIGYKPKQIAADLGVHVSTIYREVKRGTYTHMNSDLTTDIRYSPEIAEARYQESLSAKGAPLKIGKNHAVAAFIEDKIINDDYSPAAVCALLHREEFAHFGMTFCRATLYKYIDEGVFLELTNADLPEKGERKKEYKKVRPRQKRESRGTPIDERPEIINERKEPGHWEMDTVVGKKKTKARLLVLSERVTRREIIIRIKDGRAGTVVQALDRLERIYGAAFYTVFKSITVDNGSEFADADGIARSAINAEEKRTALYYCHAYCSCERGTNENINRMIRRRFPKGTDFETVTDADVARVEDWINNYPREILGFQSSAQMFSAAFAAAA
jgi:IS30 family transposase